MREALALDPKHPKALALAGTAAMDANDFAAALKYWETLAAEVPAGSEDETQIRALIGELRAKAGLARPSLALAPKQPSQPAATPSVGSPPGALPSSAPLFARYLR